VPPNTRSGIQISRLQNIERQGQASKAFKRNDFMLRVLEKAASVAGDYYPETSDRHLLRVVGKENSVDVLSLKGVKISSKYAIYIQNSSGFAADTAVRIEELGFIRQNLPGLVLPQQEADILGLRSPQKFYDITTAALRTAEAENDTMNDGRSVPAPLKEEDHIQHWITHVIDFNTMAYKRMDPKVRKLKLDHLMVHEMWMEEIAAQNPMFKQKLAALDRYPLVFAINKDRVAIESEMGPPPAPPMQIPGMLQPGQTPPAPKGKAPAPKLM